MERLSTRNHRQDRITWMCRVMVNGVARDDSVRVVVERLSGVRIWIEAWKVAARNIQPDAVPGPEQVRGRIELNDESISLAGIHLLGALERVAKARANDSILEVHLDTFGIVCSGRMHIEEFRSEVCVNR